MSAEPLGLSLYRAATAALEPLAPALLRRRASRGKEDLARLEERLGRPALPRPDGALAWLHGVSVGETLSLLPVVEGLTAARPDLTVLVTSGTVTSAELLRRRLPSGVIHQFAPIDGPRAAARFAAHWRPDLAVMVESELWPNLLAAARRQGARLALVSARLSPASVRRWARTPASARRLLGLFDLILPQDDAAAARLAQLGGRDDGRLNLKLTGDPLPADPGMREEAQASLGGRPLLLAASTHPGEDEAVLEVFAWLKDRPERPVLVIVPRHPIRGESIAERARAQGFRTARRAAGVPLTGAVEVYVADTLGELGLWFRLARGALIGGSLVDAVGGHNPLEAARLDCPAASGPHVANWESVYAALAAVDGIRRVEGPATLAGFFAEALVGGPDLQAQARRARALADAQGGAVDQAVARLLELLDRPAPAIPQ